MDEIPHVRLTQALLVETQQRLATAAVKAQTNRDVNHKAEEPKRRTNRLLIEYAQIEKLAPSRLSELLDDDLKAYSKHRSKLLSVALELLSVDPNVWQSKDLNSRIWKQWFHNFIEEYRQRLRTTQPIGPSKKNATEFVDTAGDITEDRRAALLQLLDVAFDFLTETVRILADESSFAHLLSQCLIHFGDTARYYTSIFEQSTTTRRHRSIAVACYTAALKLEPENGKCYNQMATLAVHSHQDFEAVYYYTRSLAAAQPFQGAKEALLAVFSRHYQPTETKVSKSGFGDSKAARKSDASAKAVQSNVGSDSSPKSLFEKKLLSVVGSLLTRVGLDNFQRELAGLPVVAKTIFETNFNQAQQAIVISVFTVYHVFKREGNSSTLVGDALSVLLHLGLTACELYLSNQTQTSLRCLHICLQWLAESEAIWTNIDITFALKYSQVFDRFWSSVAAVLNSLCSSSLSNNETVSLNVLEEVNLLRGFTPLPAWCNLTSNASGCFSDELKRLEIPPFTIDQMNERTSVNAAIDNFSFDNNADNEQIRATALLQVGHKLVTFPKSYLRVLDDNSFAAVPVAAVQNLAPNSFTSTIEDEVEQPIEIKLDWSEQFGGEPDSKEMLLLKERRQQLLSQMHTDSSLPSSSSHSKVDKASQKPSPGAQLQPHVTHIVLDTNCLIGSMTFVEELLQSQQFVLVVPLIVLSELEGLSHGADGVSKPAVTALNWIKQEFNLKNRFLRCQTTHGSLLSTLSFRIETPAAATRSTNDDIILAGCLALEQALAPTYKSRVGALVALLSDDVNLRIKARAAAIVTTDAKDLRSTLRNISAS